MTSCHAGLKDAVMTKVTLQNTKPTQFQELLTAYLAATRMPKSILREINKALPKDHAPVTEEILKSLKTNPDSPHLTEELGKALCAAFAADVTFCLVDKVTQKKKLSFDDEDRIKLQRAVWGAIDCRNNRAGREQHQINLRALFADNSSSDQPPENLSAESENQDTTLELIKEAIEGKTSFASVFVHMMKSKNIGVNPLAQAAKVSVTAIQAIKKGKAVRLELAVPIANYFFAPEERGTDAYCHFICLAINKKPLLPKEIIVANRTYPLDTQEDLLMLMAFAGYTPHSVAKPINIDTFDLETQIFAQALSPETAEAIAKTCAIPSDYMTRYIKKQSPDIKPCMD